MNHKLLTRHFVSRRLAQYYAQPANVVVGKSAGIESQKLSSSLGEWHWRRLLKKHYEEREGHWLTPVELFQPHFSRILAEFCCQAVQLRTTTTSLPRSCENLESSNLHIIELGCGQGTNANLILSYLQETKPEIYDGVTYTLVDSSPTLHRHQMDRLKNGEHAAKIQFQQTDLADVAEQKAELVTESEVPTVVLAMEVLDNLPHDKVQARSRKRILQAEVHTNPNGNGEVEEVFRTLQDPLLSKIVRSVPSFVKTYPTWIPTVACGVLEHIILRRPNLGLAFADFDWLPAPDLVVDAAAPITRRSTWGEGEPIITDMEGVDHECYLLAPKRCDILFPTDFTKLGHFASKIVSNIGESNRGTTVMVEKQAEFLNRYGSHHVLKTKSWLTGHTPLLHDFVNCSVLSITQRMEAE